MHESLLRKLIVGHFLALITLGLAWELWLAPLRPGGSMLALKVLPLALALPGLLRGHIRTYQWWSMIVLIYLMEGLVRGPSDAGLSAILGWVEALISASAFLIILFYVRDRRLRAGPPSN